MDFSWSIQDEGFTLVEFIYLYRFIYIFYTYIYVCSGACYFALLFYFRLLNTMEKFKEDLEVKFTNLQME